MNNKHRYKAMNNHNLLFFQSFEGKRALITSQNFHRPQEGYHFDSNLLKQTKNIAHISHHFFALLDLFVFSHRARNWVRHDTRGIMGNLVAGNACKVRLDFLDDWNKWESFWCRKSYKGIKRSVYMEQFPARKQEFAQVATTEAGAVSCETNKQTIQVS